MLSNRFTTVKKIIITTREIVGWIQIALTPSLFGFGIGYLLRCYLDNIAGIILGILIALTGIISGIVVATQVYKTTGTTDFLSTSYGERKRRRNTTIF